MATTTNTGEKSEATQSFFVFVRDQNTGQIKTVAIPGDVQVGLNGNPADLTLLGRFSVAATNYNTDNVNKGIIQASVDDTIIGISLVITPVSGRIQVYLPATPRDGELHFVKDMTETSNTVPIDIFPSKGQSIDGQAMVTLSDPSGSLALVYFNGNWHRLVAGLGSSGGSGAGTTLSYVTINPEATLTSERHITGSIFTTNILMTDQGPKGHVYFDLSQVLGAGAGTFTYATVTVDAFGRITAISAGATPPSPTLTYLTAQHEGTLADSRFMSGGLGTTVTDGGAGSTFSFNVDPRIIPFLTGANFFTQPNTFAGGLTGSLTQLAGGHGAYIIGVGGVSVSTGSNGQVIVSSSQSTSSSIYADLYGTYLLLSASASDPNARRFVVGSGLTWTDTGPGGTFTLNATGGGGGGTVDPNAPIVVTFQTASVPSGRNIVGQGGITITDNGPGKTLAVALTPLSSQSAMVYMGHCTGSLNFGTHTAWTDLITTVPTNWFDDLQNGITRSGTTFTVTANGYYYFHAFFNQVQPSQYIAYRLSGSNGTILQRTTWQNGGQPPSIMDGIVQLTSGSSFKLQFYDSGGSNWGVSDPIGTAPDQENMRTGDVVIFRIADPLTIQNVPTAQPFGWQTAADIDFTIQPAQTFTGAATVTIAGFTFTQVNPSVASLAQVVPGTGVQWTNSAAADIFGATFSACVLGATIETFVPSYSLTDNDIRIWWWINPDSTNTNFDGAVFGVGRTGGSGPTVAGFASENITNKKGFYGGVQGYNPQINMNGTNYINSDVGGFVPFNVQMLELSRGGRFFKWYLGSGSNNIWPSLQQMVLQGYGDAQPNTEQFALLPMSGSADVSLFLGEASTGGRAIVESFRKLRVDYLVENAAAILNSNTTVTGTWQAPDSFDYLWWPLTDTQGPHALNFGTAGAIGHLTASSTTVRYNQPGGAGGLIKNAMGINVNGATNNYLGTLNTATQPTPNTSNISVSVWFRPSLEGVSLNNNHQKIVLKSYFNTISSWTTPFIAIDIGLAGTGDGQMEFGFAGLSPVGPGQNITGSCCSIGQWNHAGMTYDGAVGRVYLNGRLIFEFPQTGNIDYSQNGWWAIGGNQAIPSSEYFQGDICDVRVANTVRSDAWFAQQWAASRPDANPLISIGTFLSGGSGSGSIGADLYAAYVQLSASAENPNARRLVAGSGITFTDTGPGGTLTVASTGGGGGSDFDWIDGGNQIRSTSSVAVSDGTENAFAGQKGTDVYFYVSGTVGGGFASPKKSLFGGDVIGSGSYTSLGPGGFTGSLTQLAGGKGAYIVGLGDVTVTTNSLGQVIVSGSGGGGGTVNNTFIVSGAAAQSQAAYYGFVTSSVWWNQTTQWTPFVQALPDSTITDVVTQSVLRNGSSFQFVNGGLYAFHAGFNAYGTDAYIALRLNGVSSSHGIAMQRTTYRTSPSDQNLVVLDGIFSASVGDIWTLEYITSGTVYPWTGSIFPGGLPGGVVSRSGEVSIFLISNATGAPLSVTPGYWQTATGTINNLTASNNINYPYGTWTNVATQPIYVTGSNSQLFIAYNVQSRRSAGGSNYAQICLDGLPVDYAALSFTNGNPVLGNIGSIFVATASQGSHTITLNVMTDNNGMSLDPWGQYTSDHANLFVQEIPQLSGRAQAKAPIYSIPILAGTVATNTAFSGSKQSLGMCFFNPTLVAGFGGIARKYYFRAVLDEFTIETNMSAAIDLNDFNGIVQFPPSTIPGSIMSTSSGTAVQLQADLTSYLQFVSGSGLFEARLWRTVSGSLASLATCRNARLDVEFS